MICLDSDCIIDFLKGKENAKKIISKYVDEIVTTEINAFEIFLGIYQQKDVNIQEEESAQNFFSGMTVLSYINECGKNSARLFAALKKEGKEIEQNDCHITSIMAINGCNRIITNNKKHFERIKGMGIISY